MRASVTQKETLLRGRVIAHSTSVPPLARVGANMTKESTSFSERFVTPITFEWSLTSVRPAVSGERSMIRERLSAHFTTEPLFAGVGSVVHP